MISKFMEFSKTTKFSEPRDLLNMTGFEFVWSDNKKVLYIFPLTTRGGHPKRWFSVPRKDIPRLIETLKQLNK